MLELEQEQEYDNIEYIEVKRKVFCKERTCKLKIRSGYKYNNREERKIARKIEQLTKELNRKKGTNYPINKYEFNKMRIDYLNSKIGYKYNQEFEKRDLYG